MPGFDTATPIFFSFNGLITRLSRAYTYIIAYYCDKKYFKKWP